MDIFLSYSSDEAGLAEQMVYRLRAEGHEVFFDRQSLPPGEAYDARIRNAIEACELFVFLLSKAAIRPGSYALSELAIARERWPQPVGHVLPVAVGELDYDALPPYLAALTVFRPGGDPVAELIALIDRQQDQRARRRWVVAAATIGAVGAVGGGAWWALRPPRAAQTPVASAASVPAPASTAAPAAETPAEAAAGAAIAEPVRLLGMPTNSGWIISLDLVTPQRPREVFIRWAGEPAFRSTGFSAMRDPQTGLPRPNLQFEAEIDAAAPRATRRLELRYDDAAGMRHGPYAVDFDPQAQMVAFTRQVLEQTPSAWIAFGGSSPAGRIVYFTHLVSYKNGLREIRYSVDDESLGKRVRFEPDWSSPGAARLADSDETMVTIPKGARFVAVQPVLADGTAWPVRRFTVRPG